MYLFIYYIKVHHRILYQIQNNGVAKKKKKFQNNGCNLLFTKVKRERVGEMILNAVVWSINHLQMTTHVEKHL